MLEKYRENGINRIRLEFKVNANAMMDQSNAVLIESDWNLKD